MKADFLGKTPCILMGYPRQRTAKSLQKRKCLLIVKKVHRLWFLFFLSQVYFHFFLSPVTITMINWLNTTGKLQ